MKKILEQISLWGAILASLLLALNLPISGWAYVLFLASNISSAIILRDTNVPVVIKQQIIFFLIINVIGIVRWL